MSIDLTGLLRLQQFADSALPIGGSAHSFGLESLVDGGFLNETNIEEFLRDYLEQTGVVEAGYCSRSVARGRSGEVEPWLVLNRELGARKAARESREASAALGRRFLKLAARVSQIDLLLEAAEQATEAHLACSFGFVAGAMGLDPSVASAAYLQQSVTGLLSCCQRLMPFGQTEAHRILWDLKPLIAAVAERNGSNCFTPLLDVASARHPTLHTRLFMS